MALFAWPWALACCLHCCGDAYYCYDASQAEPNLPSSSGLLVAAGDLQANVHNSHVTAALGPAVVLA